MPEVDLDRTITLELELAEAIVLDKWLRQRDEPDYRAELPPFEQAALTARMNLVALLEKVYFPDDFGNAAVDRDEVVDAAIQRLQPVESDEYDK